MVVTVTTTTMNVIGIEALIFVALIFYLVYLANSYENQWIKLALKLFSTIIALVVSYMPLITVGLANQTGMYDNFAFAAMWGFRLFWFVWFVILMWEMFKFFQQKKNEDGMEGIE